MDGSPAVLTISNMPASYETRIPIRVDEVEFPSFEVRGLELQETQQSRKEDRDRSDREFELIARFEAEPENHDEQKEQKHQQALRLGELITLLTEHSVVAETPLKSYRTDRTVQVTDISGTDAFPEDLIGYLRDLFDNLETTIESTDDIAEDTLRSLRWYTTGLAANDETDQFLAFWLALEIIAERQEREQPNIQSRASHAMQTIRTHVQSQDMIDEIESFIDRQVTEDVGISDADADQAMDAVVRNVNDDYIKQRVNDFISKEIKHDDYNRESTAEAIEREVRETVGEEHSLVHMGMLSELSTWEDDRNALVHAGVPIENPAEKVPRMERYLKTVLRHKLDPIFTGHYASSIYPDADEVPETTALRTVLREAGQPLTAEEVEREIFAASRDIRTVREVRQLLDGHLVDLDDLGIQETTFQGDTAYEFVGQEIRFECPVCPDQFDSSYQLARHLAEEDFQDTSDGPDYHVGDHGEWREDEGLPCERRELHGIERWVLDNEDEVLVDND